MKIKIEIAVDTREQLPYKYKDSIAKCLSAGDYSIIGLENEISIERKKVCELVGIVGTGRERFERELAKLAQKQYAAIVIEGSLTQVLQPSPFSDVSVRAVVNSLLSWSVKYGVHVFFADTRPLARALTYKLLYHFARHHAVGDIVCRTTETSQSKKPEVQGQAQEQTSGKPTRRKSLSP